MQHQIIKIDESKNNKSIFIISLFLKNINLIGKRMHQNLTKSIIDFIIFLTYEYLINRKRISPYIYETVIFPSISPITIDRNHRDGLETRWAGPVVEKYISRRETSFTTATKPDRYKCARILAEAAWRKWDPWRACSCVSRQESFPWISRPHVLASCPWAPSPLPF